MSDLKSAIHPAALDLMLGSAGNAVQKGQSQYSAPVELATAIAQQLPNYRPVIVDLSCGPGNLLAGCGNKSTEYLLGLDVDPGGARLSRALANQGSAEPHPTKRQFMQADLTLLYEPMRQIDFRADCFALNPPWSLNWHAQRLEGLADSAVPAVAKTFKALSLARRETGEGARAAAGEGFTIDSTLATLMIALDGLSDNGEGFLIGYSSTLERLLFAPGAIGGELVQHIWKKQPIAELPTSDLCPLSSDSPFTTATVLYFSANHDNGPTADGKPPRFMARVSPYNSRRDTVAQWQALAERAKAMLPDARPRYNLCLHNNNIHVRLGLFDTALTRVNRESAKTAQRLHNLDGRNPMQVVMQRDERNFILGLIREDLLRRSFSEGGWTVDPELRDAVQAALTQYNAFRAPLVPLPKIQRLGYLDENDEILCVKDLGSFKAGVSYPLATRSVRFTCTQFKPNLQGEEEELELSGQELAILISRADTEYCFMDGSLRAANVKVGAESGAEAIHFTLQDLVEHFEIPEVPDIAAADPARYQAFVDQLHQLEQIAA